MKRNDFTKTKKNIFKTLFTAILIFSLIAGAFSCGNMAGSNNNNSEPQEQKTYLCIQVKNVSNSNNSARAVESSVINEHSVNTVKELSVQNLKDLVLTGKTGDATEATSLLTANTVSDLPAAGIEIEAGLWEFTLSAKLNGITFSGTKTASIIAGKQNEVSFILKPTEHFGGYEITFDVTGSDVTHYSATLKKVDTNEVIEEVEDESVTISYTNKTITLERDILDETKRLASGTYLLSVDFYNGAVSEPLNNWENYIGILDGVVTTATIALDYNNVYSITYLNDENTTLVGGMKLEDYSVRTSFELPIIKKSGFFFEGWFVADENGNATSQLVTSIAAGTTGDKTFVAKFSAPELYVKATGNDSTGDGTELNPFKTLAGACDAIEEKGGADYAWTIYVTGEITGVPLKTTESFGPSVIPDTITSENAKSILITGTTTLGQDAIPADTINRGNSRTSGEYDGNGTALSIKTAVPVTITNLKITGGYEYGQFGGGMTIAKGATVSLGDGALIARNRNVSNGRGGGIHNEGTLYMYGSAVVGDKSQTKYAVDSSGDSDWNNNNYSNWAGLGGGIFNGRYQDETVEAKLYLGYKPGEDGQPVEQTLTGGLFYNSGKGGALYNEKKSNVYFASGIIAWNSSDSQEAGAVYNDGTFEMTGGNIINNKVTGSNQAYGGGVYNAHAYSKFIMSGGIINHNKADQSSGRGGGLYNCGQFFMSGSAIIGEKYDENENEIKSVATGTSFGNIAQYGAGIYNYDNSSSNENGILYLGYMPDSDGNPKVAQFSGGIYHNYSTYSGTGLYGGGAIQSDCALMISGGTIAYNATSGSGGAICFTEGYNPIFQLSGGVIENNEAAGKGGAIAITSTNGARLTLSGNVSIPAGSDKKHDIYYNFGTKIEIADALSENFSVQLTPYAYDPEKTILVLPTGVETTSVATECSKFQVTDEINEDIGTTTHWSIGTTGNLTSGEPLGKLTITIEKETFSTMSISSRYYNAEAYANYTPGSKTGGTALYSSSTMTPGVHLVFTAPEIPQNHTYTYEWYLDGQRKAPLEVSNGESTDYYNHVLVLDTTGWIAGVYDLSLIIKDQYTENEESKTDYYSYEMHIKVKAQ